MPQLPDGLDVTKVPRSVPRANLMERAEAENARFRAGAQQAARVEAQRRYDEALAKAMAHDMEQERALARKEGRKPVYFKGSPQAPA